MAEEQRERRGHRRIKDTDVSIKICGDGFSAITQSLDVSASGIYCKVDRKIPVMTQLQIVLSVPSSGERSSAKTIKAEGVVVREHPVRSGDEILHYDIAIFFGFLSPKDKKALNRYISNKSQ